MLNNSFQQKLQQIHMLKKIRGRSWKCQLELECLVDVDLNAPFFKLPLDCLHSLQPESLIPLQHPMS